MPGYVELRRRADGLYHERDHIGALLLYRQLLDAHPHDHAIRLHVGDSLSQLGLPRRAAQVYAAVALAHLRAGRPLQGVAACCALMSVVPEAGTVIHTLAQMYGRGAGRVNDDVRAPAGPSPPTGDLGSVIEPVPAAELLHSVIAMASALEEGETPERLPPLPILSDLDQSDLRTVLGQVRRRRLKTGALLMRQGEAGDAFYLVAHGGVQVTRTDDGQTRILATLGPGAIIGEMALVTRAPRSATVAALGDVEAIEVPVRALAKIAGDSHGVALALDRFTRDRLLRNALSGSRLFRPFWPDRVSEIAPLFEPRDFEQGATLTQESEVGAGLYLVLSGACVVTRGEDDGRQVEVGQVGPGDVLGETSLLGDADTPAAATVTAQGPVTALLLPRKSFDDLIEANPEVAEDLGRLGGAREVVNAFVMDDEGFPDAEAVNADEGADDGQGDLDVEVDDPLQDEADGGLDEVPGGVDDDDDEDEDSDADS